MPPLDLKKVRHGDTIKMKDGETLEVNGAFMSTDGILLRAKQPGGSGIVSRNCKPDDVDDHTEKPK